MVSILKYTAILRDKEADGVYSTIVRPNASTNATKIWAPLTEYFINLAQYIMIIIWKPKMEKAESDNKLKTWLLRIIVVSDTQ